MTPTNVSRLRGFFAVFVRMRRIGRHFRRHPWPHPQHRSVVVDALPTGLTARLANAAAADPAALLAELDSTPEGLTAVQAAAIRARVGRNEIDREHPMSWPVHLWHCYREPFNLLLTVLALLEYLTEDRGAPVVIATMVVFSTLLRFWQESRSDRAVDALKAMVGNTTTVRRPPPDGDVDIPVRDLVPGDLLTLSAGDMVPADARLLAGKDLFVSQSAMTGESQPVEKFPRSTASASAGMRPTDLDSIVLMGTHVVSGTASAVVVATGVRTGLGAIAASLVRDDAAPTAFQVGVDRVSWLLIRLMMGMVPLVFVLNGVAHGDWLQSLLFALSIAVGLTPEMLPMIVTTTLAKGAVAMARRKVVVKRLDAIQNFGAIDVLCTDKTGTLTQDRIVLARHVDAWGDASARVLALAWLNSVHQTGLKNLLDVAILEQADAGRGIEHAGSFRKVDEMPFDFDRRRMSVVVAEPDRRHLVITKGAVDEILSVCTHVRRGDAIGPLDAPTLARLHAVTDALNDEGLRVVAVACRELPPDRDTYHIDDERDMVLAGYVAFLDPPKESTAPALQALAARGIAVKVLTGDSDRVAAKVCADVGLAPGEVLLGPQVATMEDDVLSREIEARTVFARLTPTDKERIVRRLRANGHVVGFLGDGINDAPALRAADIGISVDSGADIAKEAADIILLEKSLMVLADGVLEGRRIFANMLKYLRMAVSSNFGNVISVLVAGALLPFLPMLPLHLLVQNLLYDVSQVAIPLDAVDDEQLERPQQWRPAEIGRFMLWFGPVSSVFDLATFALMWFVFGADTPSEQTLFQSGWFIVGLLTQLLVVHMIRTSRIPFVESRASTALLGATAMVAAIGVFLPMGPLAGALRLQPLPPAYFLWLPLILAGYAWLAQQVKRRYVARHGRL